MSYSIITDKSKAFALRVIRLYKYLTTERREFLISKQLFRSGTSIGANIRESKRAQTDPDFYSKLTVALKEAEESAYWIELLYESDYITEIQFNSLYADCNEIISMLVTITKKQKQRILKTRKYESRSDGALELRTLRLPTSDLRL